ncbi:E3 ubiquitin-protein ligase COP1-like [Oopsacas minuta]|uniref:E3 ubiquitin-protein ligase COP1-like n=1 Tax=Oopsacas minuta TaxID=111878 RepID=A0AAV7JKU5_9METZ|nr:E3 ubiquitin-protein ligase COP1-like [Oopsacas minuta]
MCAATSVTPLPIAKALRVTPDVFEFSPHNRYTVYLKLEQKSAVGNTDYTPEQIIKISFKSPQKINSIKFTPRFMVSWWFYEGCYTGMDRWESSGPPPEKAELILKANLVPIQEDTDLPIYIPVKNISKQIRCPICKYWLREVRLSPCGHRYCYFCILEYLEIDSEDEDAKKPCPVKNCGLSVTTRSLVPDKDFDMLVQLILAEMFEAEKKCRMPNRPPSVSPLAFPLRRMQAVSSI